MKSFVIVGSGNVAFALGELFLLKGYEVTAVVARNELTGKALAQKLDCTYLSEFSALNKIDFDCCLIAVSDSSIPAVVAQLPQLDSPVLHTSGAAAIDLLSRFKLHGVFYPLQSFSKGVAVNWNEVPVLIEANTPNLQASLKHFASTFSNDVHLLTGAERSYLHLSAVIAANFSNSLFALAQQILQRNTSLNLPILAPLIKASVQKMLSIGPLAAQTGPAKRNDASTMELHQLLLGLSSKEAELYKQLSTLIQQQQHDYLQGEAQ